VKGLNEWMGRGGGGTEWGRNGRGMETLPSPKGAVVDNSVLGGGASVMEAGVHAFEGRGCVRKGGGWGGLPVLPPRD